ncbi:MAG: excinuclease ABC subunit UvrC [Alphaproteobacteria bacterium]
MSLENLKKELLSIPQKAGVYLMKNQAGLVIYVGKAKNLKNRVENYTRLNTLSQRISNMVMQVERVDIITTEKESEALLLEANLIKKHKPKFNVALKDDKTYPYICIDKNGKFPRIFKFRGKKKPNFVFFGPFSSASQVNTAINSIQKAFLIRPCTDNFFKSRTRPCLEYEIKRCTAPCVNLVSEHDYNLQVEQAEGFLKGKNNAIKQDLKNKMEQASQNMEYERASFFRDRIMALNAIHGSQHISFNDISDADVIGLFQEGSIIAVNIFFIRGSYLIGNRVFFPSHIDDIPPSEIIGNLIGRFYQSNIPPREIYLSNEVEEKPSLETALSEIAGTRVNIIVPKLGDKKELVEKSILNAKHALKREEEKQASNSNNLQELKEFLGLKKDIRRIEIYDNSHNFGTEAYGVMVVASVEGFEKNLYRKFKVEAGSKTGGDDYYMMHQVLKRRLKALTDDSKPDLMIIDGGKGQVNEAIKLFKEFAIYDIALLGMAKGLDRNAGNEDIIIPTNNFTNLETKNLPKDSKLLYYLQILRDEAHNFAISSHRRARNKALTDSNLDEIPGIGESRRRLLLNHFGSFSAVKEASVKDLLLVEGISKKTALKIYEYFN